MKYTSPKRVTIRSHKIILSFFVFLVLVSCSSKSGGLGTKTSKIDGMEMVFVPAGEFLMGCDPNHNGGFECMSEELPLHEVYLDAYYIDKHEVTNSQYALCVNAGGCEEPASNSSSTRDWYFGNPDFDNYPVIFIDWYSAAAYCNWAGRRLPSEAEWEKAAHGKNAQAYPWGDENPTCEIANMWNNATFSACVGDTTAVGSYPAGASPYGALDMAGNVREWTSDWYSESDYSEDLNINPIGAPYGTYKMQRGGDWSMFWLAIRTTYRGLDKPTFGEHDDGFRCAIPAP